MDKITLPLNETESHLGSPFLSTLESITNDKSLTVDGRLVKLMELSIMIQIVALDRLQALCDKGIPLHAVANKPKK